MAIEDNNK